MTWHLTFDIWQLLRSHKIFWDLKIGTDLAFYIVHLVFDIAIIYILHFTFYILHFTWLKVLTALALILVILAQSYRIFTDGFWGYLQSKRNMSDSVNNIGLRDASASKNVLLRCRWWVSVTPAAWRGSLSVAGLIWLVINIKDIKWPKIEIKSWYYSFL